ncbi:hypothetical protein Nepgr_003307 [Nepenthes gracilis]|uniref:Uncharacterized protein n=1 Tax=Nepenthes gracilis TaxID=150966 RepID=A0AAD3XDD2_NEPGR|nr:hypothetical protein Nepgr_003307 [Nepenthes gracilis]
MVIGPHVHVIETRISNYKVTPCKQTTPLQGLSAWTSMNYQRDCMNGLRHGPDYDPCWSLCGLHTRRSTDVENLSFNRTGAMRSSTFGSLFHPKITKMASKERSLEEV